MALDRGTLAKIDRRVFSELDHIDGVQLVKVPVSDAVWSTWRRYCQTIGISMGGAIAGLVTHEPGLVTHELRTVVGEASGGEVVLAERAERQAEAREARLEAWERELEARCKTPELSVHWIGDWWRDSCKPSTNPQT